MTLSSTRNTGARSCSRTMLPPPSSPNWLSRMSSAESRNSARTPALRGNGPAATNHACCPISSMCSTTRRFPRFPANLCSAITPSRTKDAHEELVRGGVFGDLDIRSLRGDLIAAGTAPAVEDRSEPVWFSVASPALLFDELQVKRTQAAKQKLPDYPAPALGQATNRP